MKPLIDGDILLHEIGWSGQHKEGEGWDISPFSTVQEILDKKIADICYGAEADEPPTIYFTESERLVELANQIKGADYYDYTPSFRYEIATTKPYKGTRKSEKPFHFYNIAAYLMSAYDFKLSQDGLEADDWLSIDQTEDTIICSRDKDLRITPGWHYSWECGKAREVGPTYTDRIGSLEKKGDKIIGYGLKFFYYQMLVGDAVDNIPGLKGYGPVKALNILSPLTTEEELYSAVKQHYKDAGMTRDYFLEQANLLWMIQDAGTAYEEPKEASQ